MRAKELLKMSDDRVIVVHLRRPRPDRAEMRSDPFWEFGSFGLTGCHARNLMNPRNKSLQGARLAFAQGGPGGARLVHLTPPVTIVAHHGCLEVTWLPIEMPFRYEQAPVLAHNNGGSDFPQLCSVLRGGKRRTIEGQFSSLFRSCAKPLESVVAKELISTYTKMRSVAESATIATSYVDALPWRPPLVDNERERTYTSLLEKVRREPRARSLINPCTTMKAGICRDGTHPD